MVKICRYCACKNQDNFNFCSNCGKPLLSSSEKNIAIDYKQLIIIAMS